jgi:hypothetical protein
VRSSRRAPSPSTLKASDVRALVDHDTGRVIGRTSAKTLRLSEDDTGLRAEIDLPDTTDGRDLAVCWSAATSVRHELRLPSSRKDTWDETGDMPTAPSRRWTCSRSPRGLSGL